MQDYLFNVLVHKRNNAGKTIGKAITDIQWGK